MFLLIDTNLYLSGRRDSNARHQPWQGCALPLSYTRELLVFFTHFSNNDRRIWFCQHLFLRVGRASSETAVGRRDRRLR